MIWTTGGASQRSCPDWSHYPILLCSWIRHLTLTAPLATPRGVAREGPGVPVTPPPPPFVGKQPTTGGKTTWKSGEKPRFGTVWPPIWKILATPLTLMYKQMCWKMIMNAIKQPDDGLNCFKGPN